jgi:acyl-coenzyme A thioesterase PaaI-like protein
MSAIGTVGLTVTTNMNINFMQKAEMETLYCTAKLLKLGKRLAVVDIAIEQPGFKSLIAHGTATYSIPPSS